MLYCEDMHPLQLVCFLTSLGYIEMVGSASDSVSFPPLGQRINFSTMTFIQISSNLMTNFWTQISLENVMNYQEDMHLSLIGF